MKIFANANEKGGAGKTTVTVHLGATLASRGLKTIIFDVDPAARLTRYFDLAPTGPNSSDVLRGQASIDDALIKVRENLFLVPADDTLNAVKTILANASAPDVRLHRAFKKMQRDDIDFAFIDCPGAWDALTRNAIFASHAVLLPINSEAAAMVDASRTIDNAAELAELTGRDLVTWPLLTHYRETTVPQLVEELCRVDFGDTLLSTRIRRAEIINKIWVTRETISDITASVAGQVGTDYSDLADEIVERSRAL